jgi:hypothetical protein
MSNQALADRTKLGLMTIKRAQAYGGVVSLTAANAERVVAVLEAEGVVFLPADGGGEGVRFRQTWSQRSVRELSEEEQAESSARPPRRRR